MNISELDQVWYAVTFALAAEYRQRGWLPPGRRDQSNSGVNASGEVDEFEDWRASQSGRD